ncbi:MAG: sulfatase-like hydrolase/transferase [Thermoanaerobaculia bacterium]
MEAAIIGLWHRSLLPTEILARFIRALPWQVALFSIIGLLISAVSLLRPLTASSVGWLAIGASSFAFLSGRLAEGILRKNPNPTGFLKALLAVAGVALCLAVVFWLLSLAKRLLPHPSRHAWPVAAWIGWSLFFLPSMHRVGPAMGWWGSNPAAWIKSLNFWDAIIALIVTVAVVLVSHVARRPKTRLAHLLVVACFLVGMAAAPNVKAASQRGALPDVLVVVLDAFRYDFLGLEVDGTSLTPNLDMFVEESVHFSNAFSPSNFTSGAMPGILTSLPQSITGWPIGEDVDTLADLLQAAGLGTLGLSTNPFVSATFGSAQGFDRFVDPNDTSDFLVANIIQIVSSIFPRASYGARLITSDLFYRASPWACHGALHLFESCDPPCFLYLHLMDPHGPYLPPMRYLPDDFTLSEFVPYFEFDHLSEMGILNSPAFRPKLDNLVQRYQGEVRRADAELGKLIGRLRQLGRWDETLVIFLSDHGEAFGEHDWAGHSGKNLSNTLIQVPFVIKPPKSWGISPRRDSTPVSTFSLVPTTMSLLGLPVPERSFGEDLSDLIRYGTGSDGDRTIVSNSTDRIYAGIRWPWKLVLKLSKGQIYERSLFHLEQDPHEMVDVIDENEVIARQIEEDVLSWRELSLEDRRESEDGTVDPATLERLRALGYIQ